MHLEKYIQEGQKVEALSTKESIQAVLGYLKGDLQYEMSITEVNDWLHRKENLRSDEVRDIVWYEEDETEVGIGFVNFSPDPDLLPVGIYFRHPRWRDGKLCRANNQIDLEFFLHIASLLRKSEERDRS